MKFRPWYCLYLVLSRLERHVIKHTVKLEDKLWNFTYGHWLHEKVWEEKVRLGLEEPDADR